MRQLPDWRASLGFGAAGLPATTAEIEFLRRSRKNILVVEDEKDIIEVLRYYLEKENYRVHVAEDGFTALEVAEKVVPNLILLDLMLPKLFDGMEVCKRLKKDERLREIPVIMSAAKAEETDKVRGLELGADGPTSQNRSVPKS